MTKHKWHAEITAFVNGEEVGRKLRIAKIWVLVEDLSEFIYVKFEFRIQPKEPVYEYQFIYKIKGSDLFWITSFHYKSLENCSENSSHIPIEPYLPSKREVLNHD